MEQLLADQLAVQQDIFDALMQVLAFLNFSVTVALPAIVITVLLWVLYKRFL